MKKLLKRFGYLENALMLSIFVFFAAGMINPMWIPLIEMKSRWFVVIISLLAGALHHFVYHTISRIMVPRGLALADRLMDEGRQDEANEIYYILLIDRMSFIDPSRRQQILDSTLDWLETQKGRFLDIKNLKGVAKRLEGRRSGGGDVRMGPTVTQTIFHEGRNVQKAKVTPPAAAQTRESEGVGHYDPESSLLELDKQLWIDAELKSRTTGKPLGDCLITMMSQISRDERIPPDRVVTIAKSLRNMAYRKFGQREDITRYVNWCSRYFGIPDDLI
ncbi:MAG: hypothetical protein H8E17_01230 [Deltaproteobacteria bacterium]|nr:hypothetical protein [Deltaproteobacteria bacterium]